MIESPMIGVLTIEREHGLPKRRRGRFFRAYRSCEFELTALPMNRLYFGLARKHGLTVYDSAYLELAQRRRIPLATLDAALAATMRKEGVQIAGAIPGDTIRIK
jgi:predicted nucleic acid-binding protein